MVEVEALRGGTYSSNAHVHRYSDSRERFQKLVHKMRRICSKSVNEEWSSSLQATYSCC